MEWNAKRGSTLAKHGRMLVSASNLTKTHPDLLMSTCIKWNEMEKEGQLILAKHGRMLVSATSLTKTHPDLLMSTCIKWHEMEKEGQH